MMQCQPYDVGATDRGFRGFTRTEPAGPLPTHLYTVYIEYSECLLTLLNPLAERACLSQVSQYLI
jgi:hypothetical protein